MHAYVPEYYDIATHAAMVNRVSSVMGPDLLAWGFSVIVRKPGQVHRWHVDVEHLRWPGVTAMLALRNTTLKSSLKVINGSHRFIATPQQVGVKNDDDAIATCLRLSGSAKLVTVDLKDGEFFLFAGTLWHGSENKGKEPRTSIIVQYSRPESKVEIPTNWDEPIVWHAARPPCILVSGRDRCGKNRLVPRPLAEMTGAVPVLDK
jgi:ectoine hydroxylase-related dioxygenase (phytanoyl-CoA dioxygenase family)